MGGLVSLWGASSFVKSIQGGIITVGGSGVGTAIITAVDTSNSILLNEGISTTDAAQGAHRVVTEITLTNSTTVTANKRDLNTTVSQQWIVVEFMPGLLKSVQRGRLIPGSGASAGIATVTAVNTAKAFPNNGGTSSDSGQNTDNFARVRLLSSTEVGANRDGTTNNWTTAWELWEFF